MKTNKLMIKTLLSAVLVLISFNSCKKSFYDINKNPNAPADVDVNFLLPSAEAAIGQALGNDIQLFGGIWAQYWTENPIASQYRTYEQYSPNASDYDYPWSALYSNGLEDMSNIVTKAKTESRPNYLACAEILEAYTYQLVTDNWGNVPYSQALQGGSNTSPKFDNQKDIYAGIIALVKDALSHIDLNGTTISPGSDDLLFAGNMSEWQQFANTLLLKMYLRLAYVDPSTAQAGVTSLANAQFLGTGQQAEIMYTTTGGNTNPLYATTSVLGTGVQNLVASSTAINFFNNNNDPRVFVFYNPTTTGLAVGIAQGDYANPALTSAPVSIPSPITGADMGDQTSAAAPVILMSSYESMFLQAEAMARGWMSGDAGSMYNQAITENFEVYQIPDSFSTAYEAQSAIAFPSGGTTDNKIKAIIIQKWAAMCGTQCDEAWTEWRRTGYPDFFVQSKASVIGAGKFPQRFFYPNVEVTTNKSLPGQSLITDKVYWDTH